MTAKALGAFAVIPGRCKASGNIEIPGAVASKAIEAHWA
jgi:hypothetical protein